MYLYNVKVCTNFILPAAFPEGLFRELAVEPYFGIIPACELLL